MIRIQVINEFSGLNDMLHSSTGGKKNNMLDTIHKALLT